MSLFIPKLWPTIWFCHDKSERLNIQTFIRWFWYRLVSITQTLFPVFQRTSEPKEKATRNFGKQLNCAKRNNNSTDNLSKLLILSFFIFSKKWFKRFLKNRMYLVFFALCVLEYPQAFLERLFFFSFSYYGLGDRDFIDKLGIRSLVWQFYSPTAR